MPDFKGLRTDLVVVNEFQFFIPAIERLRKSFIAQPESIDRMIYGINKMGYAVRGEPCPPMPRHIFEGSAREYRAARRKFARGMRHVKRERKS